MTPTSIYVHGGQAVDPDRLTCDDVRIEHIAHALGNTCRFGGHTCEFYSVAEHCVRVARLVPERYRLEALLHDAAEAYIGDVVRPLKHRTLVKTGSPWNEQQPLAEYEAKILNVIFRKFGLMPGPLSPVVVNADEAMLYTELDALVLGKLPSWQPFPPTVAREQFLAAFREYYTAMPAEEAV